jgi:hypothetical protein
MTHIVEEIKILLLLGNHLKHIRGNVSYLLTWNVKKFTVGYSTEIWPGQRPDKGNVTPRSVEVIIENIPSRCAISVKLGTHMTIRLG